MVKIKNAKELLKYCDLDKCYFPHDTEIMFDINGNELDILEIVVEGDLITRNIGGMYKIIVTGDFDGYDVNSTNIKAKNFSGMNVIAQIVDVDEIANMYEATIGSSIKAKRVEVFNKFDVLNVEAEILKCGDTNASIVIVKKLCTRNMIAFNIKAEEIKYYQVLVAVQKLSYDKISGTYDYSKHYCVMDEKTKT